MNRLEKLTESILGGLRHCLEGHGPASVKVMGPEAGKVAAVVFIVPAPAGEIVDDALNRLYDALGWTVQSEGQGEAN